MNLTAIVLTFNEQRHLARCLESLRDVADAVLVVDSFSTDATRDIAQAEGARWVQHGFVTQAAQFNWALTQLDAATGWVLRLDADEVVTPPLAEEIRTRLGTLAPEIAGVYCGRRMHFEGRPIRFGGLFPIRVLRLFRHGRGQCEQRWMDEHIKVDGPTVDFAGEIVDDNLNTLTWWTDKHNQYASREAVDLLNLRHGFLPRDSIAALCAGSQAGLKRWLKEWVYARLPGGYRAAAYFFYRYVIRLGFLDGRAGADFHVLQGFWYRYLVDAKVAEVERYMAKHQCTAPQAIREVLGIEVMQPL